MVMIYLWHILRENVWTNVMIGIFRKYIDVLLCITISSFWDHLTKLDKVLERIEKEGLKVNANNSCFAQLKLEYLGFWITREVIMPTPQKVKEIKNIDTPTTKKQSKSFVGIINYYRDMWLRKSDILSPLSDLMSKWAKWE